MNMGSIITLALTGIGGATVFIVTFMFLAHFWYWLQDKWKLHVSTKEAIRRQRDEIRKLKTELEEERRASRVLRFRIEQFELMLGNKTEATADES